MGRPAGRSEESNHSHPWAQCTGHFRMREPGCWSVRAKEGYGKRSLFVIRCRSFQELDGWYVLLQEGQWEQRRCQREISIRNTVTYVPVFLHVIVTMSSAEYAESQTRVLKENQCQVEELLCSCKTLFCGHRQSARKIHVIHHSPYASSEKKENITFFLTNHLLNKLIYIPKKKTNWLTCSSGCYYRQVISEGAS